MVRIRMKSMGRRHRPFFRICAIDSRRPRDGRPIEELGHYDPMSRNPETQTVLDVSRIRYWLSVGAQPSEKVQALLRRFKVSKPTPGEPWQVPETARPGRSGSAGPASAGEPTIPPQPQPQPERSQRRSRPPPDRSRSDVAAMAGSPPHRIDVLTLFPALFDGFLSQSIVRRAIAKGLVAIERFDIRDWAEGKHKQVDDRPFGGGPGMILMAPPVVAAVEAVAAMAEPPGRLILLSPQGRRLDQPWVEELAREPRLTLVCGRYEGFDERIIEILEPELLSVGDYVLSGGEVAAMVVMDAVDPADPRRPRRLAERGR